MKAHTVATNMSDGEGQLVALSFETRRIAVSWGSGYASHTSVYQWVNDDWGGHWRYVFARRQATAAVRDTSDSRVDGHRSELEVHVEPAARDIRDFQAWLIKQACLMKARQTEMSARAAELSAAGDFGPAAQTEFDKVRFDPTLATTISNIGHSRPRSRVLASWLATIGRRLTRGEVMREFAAQFEFPMFGSADVDAVAYVAVELGLVKPYDYEPPTGNGCGETTGVLAPKAATAWRKHGRGPWGQQTPVCGAQFWLFSMGPAYSTVRGLLPQGCEYGE